MAPLQKRPAACVKGATKKPKQAARCLTTSLPPRIRSAMQAAGARVQKCVGEDLYLIDNVTFGDASWRVYEDWAHTKEKDPLVLFFVGPSAAIANTTICPDVALWGGITIEANSIVSHYSTLDVAAFAGAVLPVIAGLLAAPGGPTQVQHAKCALSALMQRIQNPPVGYAVLRRLPPGSYIANCSQQWKGNVVNISLFKP